MARRRLAAGIARMPSSSTPAMRFSQGRLRIWRAQSRPMVGFSSSGSGTFGPGMRIANARVPKRPSSDGRNVSATRTAMATVAAAASAMVVRNGMRMIDKAANAMSTVVPAKTTEPPAVPSAIPMAWVRVALSIFFSSCASSFGDKSLRPEDEISSLRKRATMNRE